ncbi:MAG: hypothetical protein ACREVV_18170 [Steroidobacteraceae bacterium]
MKPTALLTLASALLLGTLAFAQSQQDSSTPNSQPPSNMQSNPPSSPNAPSGSSTAADSSAVSTSIAQACKKQAMDKKLSGDEKTKFIKDCKAGKKTREGH